MWKNAKFTLIENIFRQINSLVISLVKTLISRNICQKSVSVNFYNFHTVIHYLFQSWSTRGRGRGGLSRASCSNINGRSPDPSASLSPVRIGI